MGAGGEVISAAIDIGTNTVLLLVAEIPPHPTLSPPMGERVRILRDEARITRLGEGLHQEPRFLPAAQDRALAVLKEYRKIAGSLGANKIVAVGTAAFRKARNAPDFVARVKKETGIHIEIIPGEEEARLSYLSVTHDFGHLPNLVALDIGGGSAEIISKDGGVSLDLGAVVLTERIVKHDPATKDEFRSMENEINRIVGAALGPPQLKGVASSAPTLIALAGTVTTLSAIKQKLTVWDGAKVQGSVLTLTDIDEMIALFRKTTHAEKSAIPGMVRGREDTILAGSLIVRAVLKRMGLPELIVSDRGLRFGLIYERSPRERSPRGGST